MVPNPIKMGWLGGETSLFLETPIHFNRVFHYKPSILGYPYFWFNTHFLKKKTWNHHLDDDHHCSCSCHLTNPMLTSKGAVYKEPLKLPNAHVHGRSTPHCLDKSKLNQILQIPETNIYSPWKWMVGIIVSFWDGLFSGAMLVLGRVDLLKVDWKQYKCSPNGGLRLLYHGRE